MEGREEFFRRQPSLEAAVARAALCKRPDGKRYSHQTRIPLVALRTACRRLVRGTSELATCRTFEALHDAVAERIGRIHRVGKLTVYDIARRIGWHRQLEPARVFTRRVSITRITAGAKSRRSLISSPISSMTSLQHEHMRSASGSSIRFTSRGRSFETRVAPRFTFFR